MSSPFLQYKAKHSRLWIVFHTFENRIMNYITNEQYILILKIKGMLNT